MRRAAVASLISVLVTVQPVTAHDAVPYDLVRGKLAPDVALSLDRTRVGEVLTVAITVDATSDTAVLSGAQRAHPDLPILTDEPDDATGKAARTVVREAFASAAERALRGPVSRARAVGLEIEYVSRTVPMFWAAGSAAAITALARDTRVVHVDSSGTVSAALDVAAASDQATTWSHPHGYRGAGTRIAVVEYGNVRWTAPGLESIPRSRRVSYSASARVVPEPHPTAVMGIIASQSSGRRGIAPGAFFISSGTGGEAGASSTQDFAVLAAVDNAVLPGMGDADVVNLSIRQDTSDGARAMRAYVDNIVDDYDVHVAVATGNYPGHCPDSERRVNSPGSAWNAVTVGSIDDRGTRAWGDDTLSRETCYGDPVGGTFKPELSAPGVCLTVSGLSCVTGTSFASPQVAGALALIIGQNPRALRRSPQKTKAILIAATYPRRTVARRIHAREGAGSLSTKWANVIVERQVNEAGHRIAGFGAWRAEATRRDGCHRAPSSKRITIDTQPGARVRFVVSWNSHGFYRAGGDYGRNDDYANRPLSDIDLRVRTASGEVVTESESFTNTVEIVQWTADAGGMPYQVEIDPYGKGWDCSLVSEKIGWAWLAYDPGG